MPLQGSRIHASRNRGLKRFAAEAVSFQYSAIGLAFYCANNLGRGRLWAQFSTKTMLTGNSALDRSIFADILESRPGGIGSFSGIFWGGGWAELPLSEALTNGVYSGSRVVDGTRVSM